MAYLLDLPPELLVQIISVLAKEKPLSAKLLHEEPSDSLLRSSYHPLKDFSQVCRATRELSFPSLFSALKVDLTSIQGFLKFSNSRSLSSHADSLLLYVDPASRAEQLSDFEVWAPVVRIVDSVKPSTLTVLLHHLLFARILPYKLNLTNEWASGIHLQMLQLRMHKDLAHSSQTSQEITNSLNVFRMRKWTHCAVNQGSLIRDFRSNLRVASQQAPYLFYPWDREDLSSTMSVSPFEYMTSLDYIAVFPVCATMSRFCKSLDRMTNLKCLRVQLAPTPNIHVLDNPAVLWECWPVSIWYQFFGACYDTLAGYFWFTWHNGTTSIEEFINLDYVNPSLRGIIDRTVGDSLKTLGSDFNGGRWIRKKHSLTILDQ